ncbi:tribbles homolog 2 [Linepithema humile]|uniref:tribbles homolog 2 n=1 Tax=Linepithema humile TaxID=83485 RepID=UPI000623288C|nr:PREDICTED: tribbles homolog 2 [Linepithema humile]
MRVARQHPLHLQVPARNNNGKFLVGPNAGSQDAVHQQLSPRQQPQPQQPAGDESSAVVPPSCVFPTCESVPTDLHGGPTILGDRFLLLGPAEGSALYRCVDVHSGQQLVAKALTVGDKGCEALLQAHLRLEGTGAASGVAGVVEAPGGRRYLLLEGHHGDLHAYVRARRRLREPEARRLFRQAARAVATCHEYGVVLRDLKLRKFVFADEARTRLRLESLEDAVIVENDNDKLTDRRGCPAYVAPEVLRSGRAYSGKAADIWSLGVLLYTMLVGRYPFNDAEHASLFAKISRGQFAVPEGLSPRAKCLIRSLLRKEPSERPYAEDVPLHPWLSKPLRLCAPTSGSRSSCQDQLVPELPTNPQD